MTDNVTRLGLVPKNLQGSEATAEVVRFLRSIADSLESGEEQPAHKAVLVLYEDTGSKVAVRQRFCNATVVERTGILHIAAYDGVSVSD
jgi:hypothetical protein